jgi:geranylgeranyl reductase
MLPDPIMIEFFDVVIVGAGPAGLSAAELLKDTDLSVLVLERKDVVGPKPCAGGVVESIEPLAFPEHEVNNVFTHQIHIGKQIHNFASQIPVKIVDRAHLGKFQLARIEHASNITVRTGAAVKKIERGRVQTTDKTYRYRFLVGADGPSSVVRRYLKLPFAYTIGMYYDVAEIAAHISIILDGPSLGTGYIWEFPHQHFTNVGIYYDPARLTTAKAGSLLRAHLKKRGYTVEAGSYRAFPIMLDYRGCSFQENIFLAGDAAGMASKLTGEGISYAMISGREVARRILDRDYGMQTLQRLVKKKQKQDRMARMFAKMPPRTLNAAFGLFMKTAGTLYS